MTKQNKFSEYPSDFFRSNQVYVFFGGALVADKKSNFFVYYLHQSYNIFVAVYGVIVFFFELFILKDQIKDINKFVRSGGMTLTHLMGVIKGSMLYIQSNKMMNIRKILHDDRYKYEEFRSFKPGQLFQEQKRTFSYLLFIVVTSAIAVGVSGYIASLLKIHSLEGEYFPPDTNCQYFMPYPCYIFFSTETTSRCKLAMSLYFIGLETFGFQIGAFDAAYGAYICNIKAHFLSIGGAFNTIRQRSLVKLGYSPDINSFKDAWIEGLEAQMQIEIINCTKHLQTILGICTEIENLFGYIILIQMLASLGILAALLCMTAQGDLTSPDTISQIQFYFAMMTELFIFCYFGNELSLACDSIRTSIFECDWLAANKEFKIYMMMTLCRLQRPVYITVGKVSPLTLSTFLMVTRASFSVFTLYKSVM